VISPLFTDNVFLQNMMVVCKSRLDDLRQQAAEGRRGGPSNRGVESTISSLLADKTYDQLVELQRSIQDKLSSGDPVDVDYWEGLLRSLLVWKAKVGVMVSGLFLFLC
jgi:hypothetical protein